MSLPSARLKPKKPLLTPMTSDQKTSAYLARRVGKVEENQAYFRPLVERMLELMEKVDKRLELNERDHTAILNHLGILEPEE